MRLVRLSLENWRGVDARDLSFGEGVTLIEGPNEIGKSTLVEAVQMLFRELDSSKKKEVKAIQPVGQDVGSRVEAEVCAGDYHFIFAKTYNRAPQTTLDILKPERRQLTGREAHEAVENLLNQTVDMALWDALLVDQGEKVGLANLQDSAGLARALDEAAGNADETNLTEESSLFAAVQAEYEKYFTLKTGRVKYLELEKTCAEAEARLAEARAALLEVEETAEREQRQAAEVRRLSTVLPDLQKSLNGHEAAWQRVRSLAEKQSIKQTELESARTIQLDAHRALQERLQLAGEIEAGQERLEAEQQRQAPLAAETEASKAEVDAMRRAVIELRGRVASARQRLELAQGDAAHLDRQQKLAAATRRLEQLAEISGKLKAELEIRASIKVDASGLEQLRRAAGTLDIARGKRDAAATTISVTAISDLTLELDGDNLSLKASESTTRPVSSELEVRLPDLVSIRVLPSLSVAELTEETEAAEAVMNTLFARFGVQNLEESTVAYERRADAERAIEQLKSREREILQSASREEIEQLVTSLQVECRQYAEQRVSDTELPESTVAAANRVTDARTESDSVSSALEEAQEKSEMLGARYTELDGSLRTAQQELAGLVAALLDKRETLARLRAERADRALEARALQTLKVVDGLAAAVAALEAELAAASPDTVEALVENARAVFERAKSDLSDAQTNLAVLTDRLQQAQADGRFESMESAERTFEENQAALISIRRRAAAAELLWATLNRHRDAARQAYVRPLKEAIERLGEIVFGSSFEVEIGEDWSIVSRTLQGRTLAFDDLSVGAREQLGILMRLAAAQIVSSQGGVPLIIDDALGFSDPGRLQTMGAAIAAAGRNCQIIILTCTPGRFTHVGDARVERFGAA